MLLLIITVMHWHRHNHVCPVLLLLGRVIHDGLSMHMVVLTDSQANVGLLWHAILRFEVNEFVGAPNRVTQFAVKIVVFTLVMTATERLVYILASHVSMARYRIIE